VGPSYAAQVAKQVPQPEFREGYSDLAKYLDMFGPCQKLQAPGADGWWANYPKPPDEQHCKEATKLLAGAMLWNQVHYCIQLVRREVKPRFVEDSQAPRRLDEPPVKTNWLKAANLYAVADAVMKYGIVCDTANPERVKSACGRVAAEARREEPNREVVALEAAKLLLRGWEALHLGHLGGK
jgi:hypothetical protein